MPAINIIIISALLIFDFMETEWLFSKRKKKSAKFFIVWNEFYLVNVSLWSVWTRAIASPMHLGDNSRRAKKKNTNRSFHNDTTIMLAHANEQWHTALGQTQKPHTQRLWRAGIHTSHINIIAYWCAKNNNNNNIICNMLLPSSKFSQLLYNRFESWAIGFYCVLFCMRVDPQLLFILEYENWEPCFDETERSSPIYTCLMQKVEIIFITEEVINHVTGEQNSDSPFHSAKNDLSLEIRLTIHTHVRCEQIKNKRFPIIFLDSVGKLAKQRSVGTRTRKYAFEIR